MSKYNWKNIKGVGLGIVAFEATEHLANIISEVRDVFDYVTIGLLRKSYHGDPIDGTDLAEILRLRDEDKIVDNILEIELDTNKAPRVQETDKRNLLVQDIEDHGCSHALIIDSDEYYTKNSVLKALMEIDKNDYEITYCLYVNYYHDYKHFLVYPFSDGMYVPFITKTKYRFLFECNDFPLPSDPTRRYVRPFTHYDLYNPDFTVGVIGGYDVDAQWENLIKQLIEKRPLLNVKQIIEILLKHITQRVKETSHNGKFALSKEQADKINGKLVRTIGKHYTVDYHVFDWKTVKMHHFSCIRANIRKKFNDWSSKTCFQDYNDTIDQAVDSYNGFDPESQEQQTVSLLFGTPGHKVYVKPFPKQYVFPKYELSERYKPVKHYKKIAIMNLSSTNSDVDLFKKLEQCCKDTWAKDVINKKYDNIDYWTIIDTPMESHLNKANKVIYVKTNPNEENVQQLLNRWLEAYEMLEKAGYKYDWVLRTNTSTWCNIELINEFLADETDDSQTYTFKLMAAFWSLFNLYMSGAGMIWSTRNIPILKKIVEKTPKETLDLGYDDIMMSALWRQRSNKIGIRDHNDFIHSLEGKHLQDLDKNIDYDSLDFISPMFQVKTFQDTNGLYSTGGKHNVRVEQDIIKMKKVQETWEAKRDSYDIKQLAKDLRNNMDKTINVLKYSKTDWVTPNKIDEEEKAIQPFAYVEPYNNETFKFLLQRATECGYTK